MGVGGYTAGILASKFGLGPAADPAYSNVVGGAICTLLITTILPLARHLLRYRDLYLSPSVRPHH